MDDMNWISVQFYIVEQNLLCKVQQLYSGGPQTQKGLEKHLEQDREVQKKQEQHTNDFERIVYFMFTFQSEKKHVAGDYTVLYQGLRCSLG